jgi:hypothetical protein
LLTRRRARIFSPKARFPYILYSRKAHDWVRISRPKIGKRLAQRGIFQAQGEDILAKGEIPVLLSTFRRQAILPYHSNTQPQSPPNVLTKICVYSIMKVPNRCTEHVMQRRAS